VIRQIRPRLLAALSGKDREVAERVEFIVDENDFGGAPIADIYDSDQRRFIKFPIGFIIAVDTINKAMAEANFCNPSLNNDYNPNLCDGNKSALQRRFPEWMLSFQNKVKTVLKESKNVRSHKRFYDQVSMTHPLCETYLRDPQACSKLRADYDPFITDITVSSFTMIMAHELSHQLLPKHIRSDKPIAEREREADNLGADIFLKNRQIPLYAINGFILLASIEKEVDPGKARDYPDPNCRGFSVLDKLMSASARDSGWVEHFRQLGKLQEAQEYVKNIHSAAQTCPVPQEVIAKLLTLSR
jgi:hypothetical protein